MTPERRGALYVLGAALLWSTGGIGIKTVPEPALKVACYRSAFAALALTLLFRPGLRHRGAAFAAAIGSYAACVTTFVVATKWTTAANAIFLQYSGVVWVLLASPVVLKEPLRTRDALAIAVALVGMALFFVDRLAAPGGAGDAVALLSGLCFAVLILALRSERVAGAEAAVTYGNLLTALALTPFAVRHPALSARSAVILGLLGVFQIAGAYALFVRGLRHLTATQASLLGMLEPIANPLWVFLLLGEAPGAFALAGAVVVLGAIAWRTLAAGATPAPAVAAPD